MWSRQFKLNSYVVRYFHFYNITNSDGINKQIWKKNWNTLTMKYLCSIHLNIFSHFWISVCIVWHKSVMLDKKMILKALVSEKILNWHSLSLCAHLCVHFYRLSKLRQPIQRKTSQSSALRLSQFKFFHILQIKNKYVIFYSTKI